MDRTQVPPFWFPGGSRTPSGVFQTFGLPIAISGISGWSGKYFVDTPSKSSSTLQARA